MKTPDRDTQEFWATRYRNLLSKVAQVIEDEQPPVLDADEIKVPQLHALQVLTETVAQLIEDDKQYWAGGY